MAEKNKKRDPMPPPDATPEEIGEFWDTHSLADYWDETHEVEFQVNLKSRQNLLPDEDEAVKQGWRKLKKLVQSIKPANFEKLVAILLTSFLKTSFVVARSGDQPRGDARSLAGEVSIQAKRYTGKKPPDVKTIEGDIGQARRDPELHLQTYVLAVSRDTEQLSYELNAIARETGLDIVTLELSDDLSDLGALCVTYWEDICHFFALSDTNPEFSDWVQIVKNESQTREKMKDVRKKLEEGIQTQKQIQTDVEKYLLKRFNSAEGFNPINLSEAIGREKESHISDWWETEGAPICCLEGKEGHGKSWLAAKWINSIREKENIVTFWLDSRDWRGCVNILAAFRYRGGSLQHPSSIHIALRWSAATDNLDFYSHCEAISRLWREEGLISKDVSLLQRSNISIEKIRTCSCTPAECYVRNIRKRCNEFSAKNFTHPATEKNIDKKRHFLYNFSNCIP